MPGQLSSSVTPRRALSISLLETLLSSPTTAVGYLRDILEDHTLMLLSGHYIENTSETENLIWIELYKSDRVADISLAQWLALTPADTVANVLKVDIEVIHQIKKQKQILVPGK